jgi:hypothetical protein
MTVNGQNPSKTNDQSDAPSVKGRYQRPKLQLFGKVHHLTQGSKEEHFDGANTRNQD